MGTVVYAAFEESSVLLKQTELVYGEEGVVDAVALAGASRTRCHGHGAQVEVVANRVLQVMVHRTLGVARVQILAKVLGQPT